MSTDIDGLALAKEFAAGLDRWMDVPFSQAHLAALAMAAKHSIDDPDVTDAFKGPLLDFLVWCAHHAKFGPEMIKVVGLDDEFFTNLHADTPLVTHG